ncbi:2-phospho-L-lactate guanylyltransferase [Cellulomonas sp. JZ18]|uniref:2-phospho-L-lactate guanylyltransferase n=1 Tax=Cellulomonas sp. JZ18 TaxID=2654191 RepID=UPI0012D3E8D4|nr:2-phospho-L-lactate guanylyltransferase [Cellulomonas sp. JZ18]QGQ19716.1 2-phospho-L-lactate guanylyltransferase [Cellulomonas sp. JZ18]
MTGGWWVVVPVKDAHRGKSRLAGVLDDTARAALVRSMALDTLTAVRAARSVAGVVLVTPDADLAAAADALGVLVVDEPTSTPAAGGPEPGLDAAAVAGAAHVRARTPGAPVAVVPGDLPRLDPADLDVALALAAAHDHAHVPDAAGTGTTLLTATRGHRLRPRFGAGSSGRHADAGHVRLDVPVTSTLRHDVDEARDLQEA